MDPNARHLALEEENAIQVSGLDDEAPRRFMNGDDGGIPIRSKADARLNGFFEVAPGVRCEHEDAALASGEALQEKWLDFFLGQDRFRRVLKAHGTVEECPHPFADTLVLIFLVDPEHGDDDSTRLFD